jgi:protein-disulfide isomerase
MAGAPLLGNPEAAVVLVEYSDVECPFCAAFQRDTLPTLKREYFDTGKAAFAYRHLPLSAIHPRALRAAVALACADEQRRFWAFHDVLFANQQALDEASLGAHAARANVDLDQWRACMDDSLAAGRVAAEAEEAARLGLRGTPAFLVGVRDVDGRVRILQVISGARPVDDFRAALDRALAETDDDRPATKTR